jgi:phospholipase C
MNTFKQSAIAVAVLSTMGTAPAAFAGEPATPIKHVIVVVGENVSFDTLYGTYIPPAGQSIFNLVSQGIVNADGTPGPNYSKAVQKQAANKNGKYSISPKRTGEYAQLPTPSIIGALDLSTFQFAEAGPDHRFDSLTLNGPFQITKFASYYSGLGDPMHRFFQMWQQTGGDNSQPDLFTWTATTAGMGNETNGVTVDYPGQGGEQMGFYNMNLGDAPYF